MECKHCGEEMLCLDEEVYICVNEECIDFFKSDYSEEN